MKCTQNKRFTSSMYSNHYAKIEYKGMKTVGGTDYINQTQFCIPGWLDNTKIISIKNLIQISHKVQE